MVYVYLYRGQARYANLTEYLRKGWCVFAPLNCSLYLFTQKRAKPPIMKVEDFPELDVIKENWETIRDEAIALREKGYFDQTTKPGSSASYDIGFRTFFKYGWSKFYINWYGYTHKSAQELCPKSAEILSKVSSVNGAMFSLLPAGSQLTRHLDPIASSLRYHLALDTPNTDDCFINVDGNMQSWRDGEGFLFDETFLHFAKNNTEKDRLILMCDVDRPLKGPGKIFNSFFKFLLSFSVVPNVEGDKEGLVNSIFSAVTPTIARVRELKKTSPLLYKVVKYTVNALLFLLSLFIVWSVFKLIAILF